MIGPKMYYVQISIVHGFSFAGKWKKSTLQVLFFDKLEVPKALKYVPISPNGNIELSF